MGVRRFGWLLLAGFALACGGEPAAHADPGVPAPTDADAASALAGAGGEAPAGGDSPRTWYGRAAGIVEARCAGCHTTGGVAPFPLESLSDLEASAAPVRSALEDRRMPPLPPDDRECRPLSDERVMPDAERADLVRWIDDGLPEGDPADAPGSPLPSFVDEPALGEPTSRVDFGLAYVSQASLTDDYRCIVVEPGWTRATHLRAVGVEPDNLSIVHHVIVYVQLPAQQDAVDALDAADPGPGYTCFGGAGFTGAFALGGYAPGAAPRAFVGGASVTLPAGTRFVMQMHYNFLAGDGADQSGLALWELDAPSGVTPSGLVLVNRSFRIPAGDADFAATGTSAIVAPGTPVTSVGLGKLQAEPGLAWGVGAHMHTRGKAVRIDLLRDDGSEECLLDIPRWDFDWQGQYRFREPVELFAGDAVRITCRWDNSPDNQPIVDGERMPPHDVTWGEGTLDEMCLGGVQMTPLQ